MKVRSILRVKNQAFNYGAQRVHSGTGGWSSSTRVYVPRDKNQYYSTIRW